MEWGSRGRKRQRGKRSHECEEQQQSCGQAMHASPCDSEPQREASIEQNSKRAQAECGYRRRNSCPSRSLLRVVQALP